jgi:hypothetical protein
MTLWDAIDALRRQVIALQSPLKSANDLLPQVPIGGIIGWLGDEDDIPANYEIVTAADGKYVRGAITSPGTTGGALTHSHTNGTLAVTAHATAADTAVTGAGTRVTAGAHVITGAVDATNHEPPFLTWIWIRRVS